MTFDEILEEVNILSDEDKTKLVNTLGLGNTELEQTNAEEPVTEEDAGAASEERVNIDKLEKSLQVLTEENTNLRSDISKLIDSGGFFNAQENEPQKTKEETEQEIALDALFSN